MQVTKESLNNEMQISNNSTHLRTCMVTREASFIRRLKELGCINIEVTGSIADVIGKQDCSIFVIDTEIPDINNWPAPILMDPYANYKSWVFLVNKFTNNTAFEISPNNSWCFQRSYSALNELVEFLKRRADPESAKEIKEVRYLRNVRSLMIRMANGKTYILRVDDLSEADSSEIIKYNVSENARYFKVKQKSGNWFEVPWDDILYHCEPKYEYYKGNQKESVEIERAKRISENIRKIRKTRGLSITELAHKADMKRPNLSRLEHGKHIPSLETIERLSEALEATVAEIVSLK